MRTVSRPFIGPGTAPRTNNRFRSASTLTTFKPSSVKRRAPMWPGIRFPLMIRDGCVPGAMEPGLRWRVLPWVSGPPPKWWRCTTPWKPRPLVTPVIFTTSPAVKIATVTRSPGFGGEASPSPPTAIGKLWSTRGACSSAAGFTWPASAFAVRFGFCATKPSCAWPPATWTTGHGPASITVTGTCVPCSSNTRVMPSFLPINPLIGPVISLLDFDFHVHARRQIELGQRVDRLRPRVEDVDQEFVRLQLELLAALLVDVRAPEHGPQLPLGRQRDGPRDLRAGLLGRAHDVGRGLVNQRVVECLETDSDFAGHRSST